MDNSTDPRQEQRVWSRVMAAQTAARERAPTACTRVMQRDAPVFDAAAVQELYTAQCRAARAYRALAAQAAGCVRQTLCMLAEEKSHEARRLAAVYFVMTGARPCAVRPETAAHACLRESLRRAYQEELCAAELYRRYAERADAHACLLAQMARRAQCAAARLLAALEFCL